MSVIQEDEHGLYIQSEDEILRPTYKSQFRKDDEVATQRYLNGKALGVGQNRSCRTGEYIELWKTKEI